MGPTAALPRRALRKPQRWEQVWECQLSSWLAKMEISICCWRFWVPPFCSQLRWANGENQKTRICPISLDGAALMPQPPHSYGFPARGRGKKNYKGETALLFPGDFHCFPMKPCSSLLFPKSWPLCGRPDHNPGRRLPCRGTAGSPPPLCRGGECSHVCISLQGN